MKSIRTAALSWAAFCMLLVGWSAPVSAQGVVDHVIQISCDGLRPDFLQNLIAGDPDTYDSFARLQKEGSYTLNARTDYTHTITLPNHTAMITGRPVLTPEGQPDSVAHHWTVNTDPRRRQNLHNNNQYVEYIASTFDVAHDAGLLTRHFANKSKFSLYTTSYNRRNGAPDKNSAGDDNGTNKIDQNRIETQLGAIIGPFITNLKRTPEETRSYSFLHFADTDTAGHAEGWGSGPWREAVADVDDYLGQILAEIDANPRLKDKTAIIITADHGGTGKGHGEASDPQNYIIPVMVWGAGFPAGNDLYEVLGDSVANPGTARPDFNAPQQPIRNGATGNLAMLLLGLDPVPGSTIFMTKELPQAVAAGQ